MRPATREQVLLLVRRVPGQEALGLGGRGGALRARGRRSSAGTRASPASAMLPRCTGPTGTGALSAASTSASSSTTLVSTNSRSHSSTLAARQKNMLSSTCTATAGAERAHHGVAVPVRARLERRRLVEAGEGRAARLDPAHLRRREPDLPAAQADLLRQRALERRAQDPAAPAVTHDRVLRQAQDVVDELLVEVRHPALDAERHGVAVLVAEQARQAVGEQVLEQALLEVRLGAPVPGVGGPGEEVLPEEPARRQLLAPLLDAAAWPAA